MDDWNTFDAPPAAAPAPAVTVAAPLPHPGYRAQGDSTQWYDPTGGLFPEGTNMNTPEAQSRLATWQKAQASPDAQSQPWDQFDPAPAPNPAADQSTPTHATEAPTDSTYGDALNFGRTALTKAAAGIAAIPRAAQDANDYLNSLAGLPAQKYAMPAPTEQHLEDKAFDNTAPEYVPNSTAGKYGMDAATFAAPALAGGPATIIPNLIRGGLTGLAAHGLNENLPGWGVAAPVATVLAELLFHKGMGAIKPSLASGQEGKAGAILNEMNAPDATQVRPALPGMRLTTGQLTNNRGMLALDRELGTDAENEEARVGNQAVISHALDKVANGPDGADAASAQSSIVNQNEREAFNDQSNNWKAIGNASFNAKPLKQKVESFVRGMKNKPMSAQALPNAEIKAILAMPDKVPLETLQDIRSSLGASAAEASQGGKKMVAMLAGRSENGIGRLVEDHLNEPRHMLSKDPAVMARYRKAIASTKHYYDTFGDDNKAGAQIADLTGEKIAPEATLRRFLPPGSEGDGRMALSRLKLASGTGKGLDPARNYLMGELKKAIEGGTDKFDKVLSDYDYAFKDPDVFTPAQQGAIKDARDAVEQLNRTASVGDKTGSAAFERLQGGTFARELYGSFVARALPMGARIVGAAFGNTLTKSIGWEGGEEIAGQLVGAEAAGDAVKEAVKGARDRVFEVLNRVRRDPVLAKQLQMKSTAANMAMAPKVRGMLKSMGLSTAMALPKAPGADPEGDTGE